MHAHPGLWAAWPTVQKFMPMCRAPMRSFDPDLIQEPLVYRLYEVRRTALYIEYTFTVSKVP